MQKLISERYSYVQHLLSQHREELGRTAQALLEREALDAGQLQHLLKDAGESVESAEENGAVSTRLVATP